MLQSHAARALADSVHKVGAIAAIASVTAAAAKAYAPSWQAHVPAWVSETDWSWNSLCSMSAQTDWSWASLCSMSAQLRINFHDRDDAPYVPLGSLEVEAKALFEQIEGTALSEPVTERMQAAMATVQKSGYTPKRSGLPEEVSTARIEALEEELNAQRAAAWVLNQELEAEKETAAVLRHELSARSSSRDEGVPEQKEKMKVRLLEADAKKLSAELNSAKSHAAVAQAKADALAEELMRQSSEVLELRAAVIEAYTPPASPRTTSLFARLTPKSPERAQPAAARSLVFSSCTTCA